MKTKPPPVKSNPTGPGNPPLSRTEKSIRFNVVTTKSQYDYAVRLGVGNKSLGCRTALEYHRAHAAKVDALLHAFDAWNVTWDDDALVALQSARKAIDL